MDSGLRKGHSSPVPFVSIPVDTSSTVMMRSDCPVDCANESMMFPHSSSCRGGEIKSGESQRERESARPVQLPPRQGGGKHCSRGELGCMRGMQQIEASPISRG